MPDTIPLGLYMIADQVQVKTFIFISLGSLCNPDLGSIGLII